MLRQHIGVQSERRARRGQACAQANNENRQHFGPLGALNITTLLPHESKTHVDSPVVAQTLGLGYRNQSVSTQTECFPSISLPLDLSRQSVSSPAGLGIR